MATEPLWITEADVAADVTLADAIVAVRDAFGRQGEAEAAAMDKTAISWGGGNTLHALGGLLDGMVGTKTWAHTTRGATPLLVLWDADDGSLRAVIEAFALGQLRTAAVSAVATAALARPDAVTCAIIGTGKQALPQVAAVFAERRIAEIRVHSPTPEHRAAFRQRVADRLPQCDVIDCSSVGVAVADADVVTTVTRSHTAFLDAGDVAPRAHVNALGAIVPARRELHDALVAAAGIVVSDNPHIATTLSRELDMAPAVLALGDVLAGDVQAPFGGPTIFKAMGSGLGDLAVATAALERATRRGGGRRFAPPERAAPVLFDQGGSR